MLSWLLSLLPVVGKAVDAFSAYQQKKLDTVLEKYKVDGQVDHSLISALTTISVARMELLKNKFIVFLQIFLALPVGIFFWKCVVWDKVLGMGSTDALGGDIQMWAMMIMGYLFAQSALDTWKRKT